MYDRTAFQRDILSVIAGVNDTPKGLAVEAELEAYYDTETDHGRLYPPLDSLVEDGPVDKGTIDNRTNSDTLTPRAKREIDGRLDWEDQLLDEQYADPPNA